MTCFRVLAVVKTRSKSLRILRIPSIVNLVFACASARTDMLLALSHYRRAAES